METKKTTTLDDLPPEIRDSVREMAEYLPRLRRLVDALRPLSQEPTRVTLKDTPPLVPKAAVERLTGTVFQYAILAVGTALCDGDFEFLEQAARGFEFSPTISPAEWDSSVPEQINQEFEECPAVGGES